TPGIAFITRNMRCDAGVVISASHNPYSDNGIKIFDRNGYKLPDAVEDEIQNLMDQEDLNLPTGNAVGRAWRLEDSTGRYIVHIKKMFPEDLNLNGVKIAIDAAHGAAYKVAPTIFQELGAKVFVTGNQPNGTNINLECGATHPETIRKLVLETGADI